MVNQFGQNDFRITIAAHIDYLWKEASDVIRPIARVQRHQVWAEVDPRASPKAPGAIPRQEAIHANKKFTFAKTTRNGKKKSIEYYYTIVTPFVYDCFRGMYFGSVMEARYTKDAAVQAAQTCRNRELGFPCNVKDKNAGKALPHIDLPTDIRAGDIVGGLE